MNGARSGKRSKIELTINEIIFDYKQRVIDFDSILFRFYGAIPNTCVFHIIPERVKILHDRRKRHQNRALFLLQ